MDPSVVVVLVGGALIALVALVRGRPVPEPVRVRVETDRVN